MTKEEFTRAYDNVCKSNPQLKADNEFTTICMSAAKAGISDEAFKVFATALLKARNNSAQADMGKAKYTYALGYAFLVSVFGESLDKDNMSDEQYDDFMDKLVIGLNYVLKKMAHDSPNLDITDNEAMLETTQYALEALSSNFVNIVTKGGN